MEVEKVMSSLVDNNLSFFNRKVDQINLDFLTYKKFENFWPIAFIYLFKDLLGTEFSLKEFCRPCVLQ